jgi:peroxiredoxin
MQRKFGKKGLVAISVSVDDVNDKESVAEVKKFLRDTKATITNYLLDETPEVWQKKLNAEAVPCIFVFNRSGKVEQKYLEAKPKAVEKLVQRLLERK